MKKIFTFCLVLCAMAFCSLPLRAETGFRLIDGIMYLIDTKTAVAYVASRNGTTGNTPGNWYEGDIVIKSTVKYEDKSYTVKGTYPNAFSGCINLTSVSLPSTVDSIGNGTFDYCTSLTSVNIPNGVRNLYYWTFRKCTSLREITIPASVEHIAWTTFTGCEFDNFIVKSQKVLAQNSKYDGTFSGAIADAKIHHFVFGGDVHTIPTKVLADYNYTSGLYNIPERYKVTLEKEVTAIEEQAFANCPRLKSLVLSKNLTTVSTAFPFYSCKFDSLTIQNQAVLDAIGHVMGAAIDSLAHLVLKGSTITNIPEGFCAAATTLETVTLPKTLETIHDAAFYGCTALREVDFPNGAGALKTIGKQAFMESAIQTFSGSSALEAIGDAAFKNCKQLVSVSGLSSLKTLGANAFYYCVLLKDISPLNELTSLGESAFEGCLNLTSISLYAAPEIKKNTFYGCKALENVMIGIASVFGDDAFYYCKAIKSYSAGSENTVFSSQGGVLYNKDKTELVKFPPAKESYTLLSSVTSIRSKAFEYCKAGCAITSLKETPPTQPETNGLFCRAEGPAEVYVPEAVMEAYMAAWNTNMCNYHALQNGTCTVGGITYQYQSDGTAVVIASATKYSGNIIIPETFTYGSKTYSVTEIGLDAFAQCTGLTSVSLPSTLKKIGMSFNNCTGLTAITIPGNVSSIDAYAFMNCSNLKTIYCKPYQSVPYIGGTSFGLLSNDVLIYVPRVLLDEYKTQWSGMTNIKEEAIERDGLYFSIDANTLTATVIPHPNGAGGYNPLVNITIPEKIEVFGMSLTVDSIGKEAFSDCDALKSVSIPNSVKNIGFSAFYGCSALTSVTIPNSVENIGHWAFGDCSGLTSLTIPGSVASIGCQAFASCTGLKSITCNAQTPPECCESGFTNVTKSIPLYVPKGTVADYQAETAIGWKDFTNIQFVAGNCADVNKAANDAKVVLNNPVSVAFVSERFVYIQDESGTTLLYLDAADASIYAGAKIAGIEGKVKIYNELPELIPGNEVAGWTITPDGEEPYAKTITTVPTDNDLNQLVKIEDASIVAEFNASKAGEASLTLLDGEIILRNQFRLTQSFTADKRYDILAAVATVSGTKKLYFISANVHTGTGIETIDNGQWTKGIQKVLRNGQIYIIRDGRTYTITGQEVK